MNSPRNSASFNLFSLLKYLLPYGKLSYDNGCTYLGSKFKIMTTFQPHMSIANKFTLTSLEDLMITYYAINLITGKAYDATVLKSYNPHLKLKKKCLV